MQFGAFNFFFLKVLMTQPGSVSSTTSIYTSCKSDLCEEEKKFVNEIKEMKDIIKRLEGEKSKLENKLSIIDEKYNNEISFQAEFYEYVCYIIYYNKLFLK